MSIHDELGTRMKEFYEERAKYKLIRRMPVAIRIDGKSFHTFTRGFRKPFDEILMKSMQDTMKYLCAHVEGCVLGYTQSDEITLILVDYKKLNSDAFFDNEVQKLCSITASMATLEFNRAFEKNVNDYLRTIRTDYDSESEKSLINAYEKSLINGAVFDSRCFNIPKEEVTNLILWRQLDAIRNSIQMVGQANFSQKQLNGKSCSSIQEMLLSEKRINWDSYETPCKMGTCCIRDNGKWIVDYNIPKFIGEDRNYIERLLHSEE